MLRMIGVFCISVSMAAMFACDVDHPTSPNEISTPGDPETLSASPNSTTTDESLGTSTDEVITPDSCTAPRVQCGTSCCPAGDFCGGGNRCCNGSCVVGCPC